MSYAARHRQKPKRESEKHRKQHGKISTRRADFEGPPHGNVELAPRELRSFFDASSFASSLQDLSATPCRARLDTQK